MKVRNYVWALLCLFCLACSTGPQLVLKFELPDGYQFLPSAKPTVQIVSDQGQLSKTYLLKRTEQSFVLPRSFRGQTFQGSARLYYCPIGSEGVCLIHDADFTFEVREEPISIFYRLPDDFS